MGTKGPVEEGFGLCTGHHLNGPNSIENMGIRTWERKYGSQEEHAEECRRRMKMKGLI